MKTITIQTKGMHCKSCEAVLEGTFEDFGAKSSSSDHKTGVVKITFDEKKANANKFIEAIKEEGYTIISVE